MDLREFLASMNDDVGITMLSEMEKYIKAAETNEEEHRNYSYKAAAFYRRMLMTYIGDLCNRDAITVKVLLDLSKQIDSLYWDGMANVQRRNSHDNRTI